MALINGTLSDDGRLVNPALLNPTLSSTVVWDTYTGNGVTFKYPDSSNLSTYVGFQKPTVVITPQGNTNIDTNGCLSTSWYEPKNSTTTFNCINFCLSTSSDGGAGTFVNYYYYTTLKNSNYYTVEYNVTTHNCGVFGNSTSSEYQACTADSNMVSSIIQQSISTLTFNSTTGCNSLYWMDNNNQSCATPKQFCGAYMYQGLQTFPTQAQCQLNISLNVK